MTAAVDTAIVTPHYHGGVTSGMAVVRGRYRCTGCGHRLTVNGVVPRQTRTTPPWTWHLELMDRKMAQAQFQR